MRRRTLAVLLLSTSCSGGASAPETSGEHPVQTRPADVGTVVDRAYVPFDLATVGVLGGGRNAVDEALRGNACVSRPLLSSPEPVETALLRRLEHTLTPGELRALVGFAPATRRALPRLFGTDAVPGLVESPLAVTLAWAVETRVRADALDLTQASVVAAKDADFVWKCGHEVFARQALGARALLVADLRFASVEARREFEAQVGRDFPVWELGARLAAFRAAHPASAAVGLSALQYGGDPTALRVALGPDGFACVAWDAGACDAVAARFVAYATSPAFRDAAAASPADLGDVLVPWTALGVEVAPVVPPAVADARRALEALVEAQRAAIDTADALRSFAAPSGADWARIASASDAIARNVDALGEALDRCYGVWSPDPALAAAAADACAAAASPERLAARGFDASVTAEALLHPPQ